MEPGSHFGQKIRSFSIEGFTAHWIPANEPFDEAELLASMQTADIEYMKQVKSEQRRDEYLRSRSLIYHIFGASAVLKKDEGGFLSIDGGNLGSLSHKNGHVAFAVNRDPSALMGFDLEDFGHDLTAILEKILTPSERVRRGPGSPSEEPWLAFSFKESVYKCLYPACRRFFGFHDFEVTAVRPTVREGSNPGRLHAFTGGEISGRLLTDLGPLLPAGTEIRGGFLKDPAEQLGFTLASFIPT